jgi:hypothetical protein
MGNNFFLQLPDIEHVLGAEHLFQANSPWRQILKLRFFPQNLNNRKKIIMRKFITPLKTFLVTNIAGLLVSLVDRVMEIVQGIISGIYAVIGEA